MASPFWFLYLGKTLRVARAVAGREFSDEGLRLLILHLGASAGRSEMFQLVLGFVDNRSQEEIQDIPDRLVGLRGGLTALIT